MTRPDQDPPFPGRPGVEIGHMARDAKKWEVDPERTSRGFDAEYYRKLLEKAWKEAAILFRERISFCQARA